MAPIQLDNDGNIRQKKNLDGPQPSFYGAQRQNRTVDTGIFSGPGRISTLKSYHAYCGVYWLSKILHLDGPAFTTDKFQYRIGTGTWSCPQILLGPVPKCWNHIFYVQSICSWTARQAASNAAFINGVTSESVLAIEMRPNCCLPIS